MGLVHMAFLQMVVRLVARRHLKVVAAGLVLQLVLQLAVVANLVLVAIQEQVLGMTPQVAQALPVGASGVLPWKVAHAWALALVAFQVQAHSLP